MNKPFDEFWKSALNRMTALGAVLLSAGEDKGRWYCTNCQNVEDREREVICWKCGKGEMVYRASCGGEVGRVASDCPGERIPTAELAPSSAGIKFGAERAEAVPTLETWSSAKAVLTHTPSTAKTSAPIQYDGNLLPSMTAMVTGFVDKLAKFYSPCPQGKDCAGDGKHVRIFACDQCDFVGCCACMDAHEAEPHWSDSDTAREMHS